LDVEGSYFGLITIFAVLEWQEGKKIPLHFPLILLSKIDIDQFKSFVVFQILHTFIIHGCRLASFSFSHKIWVSNGDPTTVFFFQFHDGTRVESIPGQNSNELATLFQGTLKTVACTHKCDNTVPKKTVFCCSD
jgi:hypothetical protein